MTVLDALRSATAAQHERVEALLPLTGPALTRERYVATLLAFDALYAPLEDEVARALGGPAPDGWRLAAFEPAARRKRPLLDRDLRALGVTPERRAPVAAAPRLSGVAGALGALYVMEGATLGGRVIARHLHAALGLDERSGAAFFAGYGARTGEMWTGYRAQAADYVARFGGAAEMVAAAVATFDAFERWFEAQLGAPAARPVAAHG